MKASRAFRWTSWGLLAFCILVIAWGALVRATGSGAGCGAHWPLCNGEVLPMLARRKTFIEFTHRAMSGILTVWIVAWTIWAFRITEKGERIRKGVIAALVFTFLEALIGAAIVKLGLVVDNASVARAFAVGLHLVNTFFLLAAVGLTAHWASGGGALELRGQAKLGKGVWVGIIGMLVLGATGAVNALGDTLFPAKSLAQGMAQDVAPNSSFLIHLRVIHPMLAATLAMYLCVLVITGSMLRPSASVKGRGRLLLAVVICQVLAGLVNLALLAPVWMQLVHLVLANALWILLVLWSASVFEEGAPRLKTVPALAAHPP